MAARVTTTSRRWCKAKRCPGYLGVPKYWPGWHKRSPGLFFASVGLRPTFTPSAQHGRPLAGEGIMSLRESAYNSSNMIDGAEPCGQGTIMILAVAFLGFYLVDNFQNDGYYRNLVWTQSNADIPKFADQLKGWWRGQ
jgi:hypothetical protein